MVKKKIGFYKRMVSSPKNSMCGSALLHKLDFSNWWTDGGNGALYLHVEHYDKTLGTVHRVYCKASDTPRLKCEHGELFWIIDKK